VKVDALKREWPEFAAMRRLATRFRGILRNKNAAKLGVWLTDVHQSGLYAMQRFARTLRRDIDAMRNAIAESWSNGQTEGQINRLKALKRATYGRAGPTSACANVATIGAFATGTEAEFRICSAFGSRLQIVMQNPKCVPVGIGSSYAGKERHMAASCLSRATRRGLTDPDPLHKLREKS